MFKILFTLKEQNSKIISLLVTKKNEELLQGNSLPDNFPKLPVINESDLDNLEILLESKENRNILVCFSMIIDLFLIFVF